MQLDAFDIHKILVRGTISVRFAPFTVTSAAADAPLPAPQRFRVQFARTAHGQNSDTPPTAITTANGLFGFDETAAATRMHVCCSSAPTVEQLKELVTEGDPDGTPDGNAEAAANDVVEGEPEGIPEKDADNVLEGNTDGIPDGTRVRDADGIPGTIAANGELEGEAETCVSKTSICSNSSASSIVASTAKFRGHARHKSSQHNR